MQKDRPTNMDTETHAEIELTRLREIERLAGEFTARHLRDHRLANPDGACGCNLCIMAHTLKAKIEEGK